MPVKTSNFKFI